MTRITRKKTSSVKKRVLEQMRALRTRFEDEHPGLLEEVREQYTKAQGDAQEQKKPDSLIDDYLVDKKKNLMTILEFSQMQTGSDEFQKRLKTLISKSIH